MLRGGENVSAASVGRSWPERTHEEAMWRGDAGLASREWSGILQRKLTPAIL